MHIKLPIVASSIKNIPDQLNSSEQRWQLGPTPVPSACGIPHQPKRQPSEQHAFVASLQSATSQALAQQWVLTLFFHPDRSTCDLKLILLLHSSYKNTNLIKLSISYKDFKSRSFLISKMYTRLSLG